MILYHFTAKHLIDGILKDGLTKGCYPLVTINSFSFAKNCQWLTTNSNFNNQSWNTSIAIKYVRNHYRLAIEIPDEKIERHLIKALAYEKTIPKKFERVVSGWQGCRDWYIYKGKIPKEWIIDVAENESFIICNETENEPLQRKRYNG